MRLVYFCNTMGRTKLRWNQAVLFCAQWNGFINYRDAFQRESHLRTSLGWYIGTNETHAYGATCSGRPSIAVHLRAGDVTSGKFDNEGNLSSFKGYRNYSSRAAKQSRRVIFTPRRFMSTHWTRSSTTLLILVTTRVWKLISASRTSSAPRASHFLLVD